MESSQIPPFDEYFRSSDMDKTHNNDVAYTNTYESFQKEIEGIHNFDHLEDDTDSSITEDVEQGSDMGVTYRQSQIFNELLELI